MSKDTRTRTKARAKKKAKAKTKLATNKYVLVAKLMPNHLLDVADEGGQNKVGKHEKGQSIEWQLDPATPADFTFPTDAFTWIPSTKPHTPFRDPEVKSKGRTLTMKVYHRNDLSKGEWIYMLKVSNPAGEVYATTISDGRVVTINNPVIINR